jgi:histidinol-phosphate aminotransferase
MNRRNWFKTTSLLAAGFCLPKLETFASPRPFMPEGNDVSAPIRLCFNENPYGPSPAARAAMAEQIAKSNRYPWEMINSLMSAVATKNNLSKESVLVAAGSTEILDAVVRFAAREKGNFILGKPTFNHWADAAENAGLQKIEVPLTADKKLDLSAMLAAIRTDTRLIYLCNPNNPTGTVCNADSIRSFVKEATKKTLVMIDEAYLDYSGQPSMADMTKDNENLIVTKTFSKIYGLAGARIGYACGHSKTIEKLSDQQSGSNMGISAVSLAAASVSLNDAGFINQTRTLNEEANKYTVESMKRLGINSIPTQTNFIYFSLVDYKKDFSGLLKSKNILGTGIWEEEGKWSRISIGTMEEMKYLIGAIS